MRGCAEQILREGLPWLRRLEGWGRPSGDPGRRLELEGLPREGPGLVLFGNLTDAEVQARAERIGGEAADADAWLRRVVPRADLPQRQRDLAEDVCCYGGWAWQWPLEPAPPPPGQAPAEEPGPRKSWETLLCYRGQEWAEAYLDALRRSARPVRPAPRAADPDKDEDDKNDDPAVPGRTLIRGADAERALRAETVDPWEVAERALRRVLPARDVPRSYWDYACQGPDGTESGYVPFLLRFRRRVGDELRQALRPRDALARDGNALGDDLIETLALLSAAPLAKALGGADEVAVGAEVEAGARRLDDRALARVKNRNYLAELEAVRRGDPPSNYDLRRHAKDRYRDARLDVCREAVQPAGAGAVAAALGGLWGEHAGRLLDACAASLSWPDIVARVTGARPRRGPRAAAAGSWREDALLESAALLVAAAVAEILARASSTTGPGASVR